MASRHGASKCEAQALAFIKNNDGVGDAVQLSAGGRSVEKQGFENWTLVVTIRGESQFSDINPTFSVSYQAPD